MGLGTAHTAFASLIRALAIVGFVVGLKYASTKENVSQAIPASSADR